MNSVGHSNKYHLFAINSETRQLLSSFLGFPVLLGEMFELFFFGSMVHSVVH